MKMRNTVFLVAGIFGMMGHVLAADSRKTAVPAEDGKLFHRIFSARVIDFDQTAIDDLGFKPLRCRVYDPRTPTSKTDASPTIVFRSRRLTYCLFEMLFARLQDQEERLYVVTEIKLLGSKSKDRYRTVKMDWRPTQVFDTEEGRWAKFLRTVVPARAAIHYYSLLDSFFASWFSSDLIIDFDRAVTLQDFSVPAEAEWLIVGGSENAAMTRIQIHTAQLDRSNEGQTMKGLALGFNKNGKKVMALEVRHAWRLRHKSVSPLDIKSH